jgi:tetratricopeptide (TPR) repeat protein
MRVRTLIFSAIVCLAPAIVGAEPRGQEPAAARVETADQWDEAIRAHRAALERDPSRWDLWVQIADIEAQRGQVAACVDALEHAVMLAPGSPDLYERLSQAYATAGSGKAALHAMEGALALKPNEPAYLRAHATLATWVGQYRAAQESYRQLRVLYPHDLAITLALARVSAWVGDTDQAVAAYRSYLRADGATPAVWLELAKAESWRGNYAAAIEALDAYRTHFGETEQYNAERAAVFANGGQPAKAEDLLKPLLAQSPDNYELNLTHAIALARQQRTKEAFATLETARTLSPGRAETRSAEQVLRTLLGSSAGSPFSVYDDSDNLQVQRFSPQGVVSLRTGTWLSAGYQRTRLEAREGSGLDAVDGSPIAHVEHIWMRAAQRVGSMTVYGQAGYATGAEHVMNTYDIGFDARLADTIRIALAHASEPFVVSPRTVGLGITTVSQHAQLEWSPTLRSQLVFDGAFQELSDGNRRWEMSISPRRTVARRAGFNLDLGALAYRSETRHDFDHGYYDPRSYEFYAVTMYPYIKVRENIGLALMMALGAQRDDHSRSFHPGANVSGEATFGIYRPWALKVSSTATVNGRLDSGAFRGFGAGATLVRRF